MVGHAESREVAPTGQEGSNYHRSHFLAWETWVCSRWEWTGQWVCCARIFPFLICFSILFLFPSRILFLGGEVARVDLNELPYTLGGWHQFLYPLPLVCGLILFA
jgi:hypothetical protein